MNLPERKRIRLENYDYGQNGAYFITICTAQKQKILCKIRTDNPENGAKIILSKTGFIVDEVIRGIPGLNKYVIMPNHIHFIITNDEKRQLSSIIRIFKTNVTRKIGYNIWQTRYYDHVIRDEEDYLIKWKYIDDNPAKWNTDEYA